MLLNKTNFCILQSKDMSKMKTGVGPHGHGTTTLSTIAVKSGETKLVIALLQSGSRDAPSLQLRILDMDPEFAWLGNNFTEATSLQKQQQQVMEKLHNKQSPVEELLRQADQMIVTQEPRAEVYSGMADSLGQAWRDLNTVLEERKTLLDLNFSFQGHYQNFRTKADELMTLCYLSEKQSSSLQDLSNNLKHQRRGLLEHAVYALQVT